MKPWSWGSSIPKPSSPPAFSSSASWPSVPRAARLPTPPDPQLEESAMNKMNRDQMAQRVARDIPEGAYVNLGIGLPTLVANHLPADREVVLHTENGL